jgi:hypothetical protein
MSEWKSADIVTTTYGTIKKAQQESFDEGVAFERDRIIYKLEHALWPTEIGMMNLSDTLLNWIVAKGDDLTAGDIDQMAKKIIALIKGEDK